MEKRFLKERTQKCEELMKPEARELLDLPLSEKVAKSKEIMKEAFEKYDNVGMGFSGGTDSLVLLHLALQVKPDIPTVYVDTQFDFPELYDFVEKVRRDWHLTYHITVMADKNKYEDFVKKYGEKTHDFTVQCCKYHKIDPMLKAIKTQGYDAFMVGLRGVEHEERATETFFSPREEPKHIRVHPLLFWRKEDILQYVKENDIKCCSLYDRGYTSLGCTHCTRKNPDPKMHERAGRGTVREKGMKILRNLGYT